MYRENYSANNTGSTTNYVPSVILTLAAASQFQHPSPAVEPLSLPCWNLWFLAMVHKKDLKTFLQNYYQHGFVLDFQAMYKHTHTPYTKLYVVTSRDASYRHLGVWFSHVRFSRQ